MRKKIIVSIIGVVVGLWLVLFASNGQVLVWEEVHPAYSYYQHKNIVSKKQSGSSGKSFSYVTSFESFEACTKEAERLGVNVFDCEEEIRQRFITCTYFNGRRFFIDSFRKYVACPNYRNSLKVKRRFTDEELFGGRLLPMD